MFATQNGNPPNQSGCRKQMYIPGKPSALFFKAIVAGFRGKVALKNRTLGVPGIYIYIYKLHKHILDP